MGEFKMVLFDKLDRQRAALKAKQDALDTALSDVERTKTSLAGKIENLKAELNAEFEEKRAAFSVELEAKRAEFAADEERKRAALDEELKNKQEENESRWASVEDALVKRKNELDKREAALETLRADIQQKYSDNQSYHQSLLQYNSKLSEMERHIKEREKNLKYQETQIKVMDEAFRKIEYNALITINRWEKKEWNYLRELQEAGYKLSEYSAIVRRRNGFRFESYVADMLRENGFTDVQVTKQSGDFGGDVFAVKNGLNYIFQCKYYAQPVGIHAVQEAASALMPYNADRAVVVTNNVFTTAAIQLAKANDVELWDCSDIARMNTKGEFY